MRMVLIGVTFADIVLMDNFNWKEIKTLDKERQRELSKLKRLKRKLNFKNE
jgi:hypothetical protein